MTKQLLIPGLGYLGLLPFLVGAWLVIYDSTQPDLNPELLFLGYSTVILAFLSGALWGRALELSDSLLTRSLLVMSNLIALFGWISLYVGSVGYGIAVLCLAIGYALLLILELQYARLVYADIDRKYLGMRITLTIAVIAIHVLVFLVGI